MEVSLDLQPAADIYPKLNSPEAVTICSNEAGLPVCPDGNVQNKFIGSLSIMARTFYTLLLSQKDSNVTLGTSCKSRTITLVLSIHPLRVN